MTIELTHEQATILRAINLDVWTSRYIGDPCIGSDDLSWAIDDCEIQMLTPAGKAALADYDAKYFVQSVEAAHMRSLVGCFDGGCIWRRPTGMCTNGGCSCERDLRRRLKSLGYSLTDTMCFVSAIRSVRDEIREGK